MKCPGQDTQFWKPNAIYEEKCPECGSIIEFFKDDTSRRCRGCGKKIVNPKMDFGCAAYCPYAEECIGTLPEEFIKQREDLLKDRVAVEVKRYFKTDFKRIGHAVKVARHAEDLGKKEHANLSVILTSAYLHDIGLKKAEQNNPATAQKMREQEGISPARQILETLNAKEALIEEVCDIVGRHHHPGQDESLNFKVVYDAAQIVNLEEQIKAEEMTTDQIKQKIDQKFLTESGRKKAEALFL
ncbi:MAG: HD domain-containing protein [Thermodesulfobacteriota bacterium]|nr:HD domain-containing protein [Thermodesulfobacteriota bacterium]